MRPEDLGATAAGPKGENYPESKRLRKLLFIVALGTALSCVQAEKRTTDHLVDKSDAVVVGEIQSGRQTGYYVSFVLSVIRTLKGDVTPGAAVNVTWESALRASYDLKGNYGLWFLRRAPGGEWRLQRVLEGSVPFEFAYFRLPRASTPADVPFAVPPTSVTDLLAAEFVAALRISTDRSQRYHLASGLIDIGESTTTPELFRALRASADPDLRFLGLAGLLKANDTSALAEIANNVHLIPSLDIGRFVLNAIEARRDVDPVAIGHLGRIASSPDKGAQRAVAEALKYVHTRDTLPILAQLLESDDPRTREAAMFGLSRFVENLPVATLYNTLNGKASIPQGPQPYRTPETAKYSLSMRRVDPADEPQYVQFWRSWWASMKDKLTAGPVTPPTGRP